MSKMQLVFVILAVVSGSQGYDHRRKWLPGLLLDQIDREELNRIEDELNGETIRELSEFFKTPCLNCEESETMEDWYHDDRRQRESEQTLFDCGSIKPCDNPQDEFTNKICNKRDCLRGIGEYCTVSYGEDHKSSDMEGKRCKKFLRCNDDNRCSLLKDFKVTKRPALIGTDPMTDCLSHSHCPQRRHKSPASPNIPNNLIYM